MSGNSLLRRQDWLASEPYFYNQITGKHGSNISEVIDIGSFEIDRAGLGDYLRFGYCVFGYTPVRGVKFLRPLEELVRKDDGSLEVHKSSLDPALRYRDQRTTEVEALERFYAWQPNTTNSDEILPLSGGLDSRLILGHRLAAGKKPRCFTYGTSRRQTDSNEIAIARQITEKCQVEWEAINLAGFHSNAQRWISSFGISTHLHGMYQIAFFDAIRRRVDNGCVLSGLVGDAWAGNITTQPPRQPRDLMKLGLMHGLNVDSDQFNKNFTESNLEQEFELVRKDLHDEFGRVLYLVRTKMILLSYLLSIPRGIGFDVSAPFINEHIALSFLTIDPSRRENRIWQLEHLEEISLTVRSDVSVKSNYLDLGELERSPLPPLNLKIMSTYVKKEYLEWINQKVGKLSLYDRLWLRLIEFKCVLPSVGKWLLSDQTIVAYNAYLSLYPLQELLIGFESRLTKGTSE